MASTFSPPVISAGSNIAVERTVDGYRINAFQRRLMTYDGQFAVRADSSPGKIRLLNGVTDDTSGNAPAGYATLIHLYTEKAPQADAAPLIRAIRHRLPIPAVNAIPVPENASNLILKLTAAVGDAPAPNGFTDPFWGAIRITSELTATATQPEPSPGEVVIPLAMLTYDANSQAMTVTQLQYGEIKELLLELAEEASESFSSSSSSSSSSLSSSSSSASSSSSSASVPAEGYYIFNTNLRRGKECTGELISRPGYHLITKAPLPVLCENVISNGAFQYSKEIVIVAGPFATYDDAEAYNRENP